MLEAETGSGLIVPRHVLVDTDIGRDPDDALLLATLAGMYRLGLIDSIDVTTTYMVPAYRAEVIYDMFQHLGVPVNVGVGAQRPMRQLGQSTQEYIREHTVNGNFYEGRGLDPLLPSQLPFPGPGASRVVRDIGSAEEVLEDAIAKYGKDLAILAAAPMTNIGRLAERRPNLLRKVGALYVQGQVLTEDGELVDKDLQLWPNDASYNMRLDDTAANTVIETIQQHVMMTFIGKHALSDVLLNREEFARYAATGHPIGTYLQAHAIDSMAAFAERDPETFHTVYGADAVPKTMPVLSKPYDVLLALALVKPDFFNFQRFNMPRDYDNESAGYITHQFLGQESGRQHEEVPNPMAVIQYMGRCIMEALKYQSIRRG